MARMMGLLVTVGLIASSVVALGGGQVAGAKTAKARLEVCKVVAAGSPLIGQDFSFTEKAGNKSIGPFNLEAEVANSGNPNQCGGRTFYPVGTNVTLKESGSRGDNDVFMSGVIVNGRPIPFTGRRPGCGTAYGGGGSAVATTVAGTTVVDVTNTIEAPPQCGDLEICVLAGDSTVGPGPWTFSVTAKGIVPITESVPTGQCSSAIGPALGRYRVTESIAAPDYVSDIYGDPMAPVSINLAKDRASFEVYANASETAVFTDS